MAMDLSWSDSLRAAFAGCFPSSRAPDVSNPDLAQLLADDDVSLHSNMRPHRTRTRPHKSFTFCGIPNPFGRREQAISLPGEEDGILPVRSRTQSYDSDPAPLDPDTLTVERMQRRAKRRERRRREREALVPPPAPPVVDVAPPPDGEDADEDADLDGATYFQTSARKYLGGGGSGSQSSGPSSAGSYTPHSMHVPKRARSSTTSDTLAEERDAHLDFDGVVGGKL